MYDMDEPTEQNYYIIGIFKMQQFFYKIKIAVTDLLLFTLTPDLGIMLKLKKHLSTRIHHKGIPESEDRNTRTRTLSGRVCE